MGKKPLTRIIKQKITYFRFMCEQWFYRLKDRSKKCDFDDDNPKNRCRRCTYFCFPIGCMYFENH
jgi:hypothetical protein